MSSRCPRTFHRALSTFLIIGVFVLALLIRLDRFTERWSDYFALNGWSHMGWAGAFYSTIGRNYLRYGLLTWLGPTVTTGLPLSNQLAFYPNHPPLLGWLIAISFTVFGMHEWATRLVPLGFSLSGLLLFYALVTRYFSTHVSLIAMLIMAVVPMAAYYLGSFPDVQGPHVLFFMLLSLFFYFRWIESGKRIHLIGLALAILCGILSDWPGVYSPLVLVTYHWFAQPRKKFPPMAILLAVSMILTLGLICYLSWLVHDPWTFLRAFLFWSIASKPGLPNISSLPLAIFDWITTVLGNHVLFLYTPVVLSLASSYLIVGWFRTDGGRSGYQFHLVSLLLILGLLHIGLGLRGAAVHSYWSMYLTPGLVLAAALWLSGLSDPKTRQSPEVRITSLLASCTVGLLGLYCVAKRLDWQVSTGYFVVILLFGLAPFIPEGTVRRRWDTARITIALGLVCFVLAAWAQTRMISRRDNEGGLGAYLAAAVLREQTNASEEILAGPSIAWGWNPPFTYYADRPFIRVDGIESLAAYESEGRFRYLILSKKDLDNDLAAHVTPRFHAVAVGGYLLIDLKRPFESPAS